jgi:hypothetical protein
MVLNISVLIVAVCLGIVVADARAPRLRPTPLAASVLLVLALVAGVMTFVPDRSILGVVAAVLFVISADMYGAVVWRRVLGKEQLSFATALRYGIAGPSQLRARYEGIREETRSESSLQP